MPRLACCLLTVCLTATLSAQTSENSSSSYKENPKFLSALKDAKQYLGQRQYIFAEDAYKKANKIAGGQDFTTLKGLFDLQNDLGHFKDAVGTASQMEAIATTPTAKSTAQTFRGLALYRQSGEKYKTELLQAADAAFKAALASDPKNGTAHYFDGTVLARLGQLDSAGQEFKQCLSCISPNDPSYLRAQHFAANPALSTAKFAPPVQVVALDGSKFNLDAMGGRVVLIDFWATWCGPCNEELPHLKKIAKEFAGQPLVIISISWDSDETKWKNFIQKNEMTWVQYRDADHKLSKNFGVEAIPHYFTIDADGVLTAEMLGSGSDVEGKLKKLIPKAKARPAQPALTATAGN